MSTTDLAQQVADLTTATTKLTEEVVGQKDRLTAAADTATSKASESTGSASAAASSASSAANSVVLAANEVTKAEQQVDLAEAEVAKAKEITGLGTVEDAVDLAMSEFAGVMTEAQARAINQQNEGKFAASGMVHSGKHYGGSGVNVANEGMWTLPNTSAFADMITLGRGSSPEGSSKADFAVTHIAGVVANLVGTRDGASANLPEFRFHLPPAPDGTVIYDSTGDARGSGKASLDLKVDIDPKYGDAPTGTEAEVLREGVGRAHEGQVKNGDFRLGDNGDWSLSSTWSIVNGELISTNSANASISHQFADNVEIGKSYTYKIVCNEITSGSFRLYVRGASSYYGYVDLVVGENTLTRVATEAAERLVVYALSNGSSGKFSNASVTLVTEEVVTHPVDLVGLEYYEEELTGRQEIFECIQSLSTTFGTTSVPTVLSTRKLSYFQQYDGQFPEVTADPDYINDRYRCVVWDDLTEPQKREVAAYMGEKLFVGVNGHIVNGRLRARTIRGLGNGDWSNIESNDGSKATGYLRFANGIGGVEPQGSKDTVLPYRNGAFSMYVGTEQDVNIAPERGVFSVRGAVDGSNPEEYAYQGRCFFYVVATVPRANKGAYHPDLNPYGTKMHDSTRGIGFSQQWYESTAVKLTTSKDAFTVSSTTGAIGQLSGHPDGISYDGIEAGGLNGVIDWRLPANPMDTKEEASKVFSKVVNGTYRGLEKLAKFEVQNNVTPAGSSQLVYTDGNIGMLDVGSPVWIRLDEVGASTSPLTVGTLYTGVIAKHTSGRPVVAVDGVGASLVASGSASTFVMMIAGTVEVNLSVSGEFNTQMVIGDPANILQTDALKDGWLGTWCPDIPDGVKTSFTFSKKALGSNLLHNLRTSDTGATWVSVSTDFDAVLNDKNVNWATGDVVISAYKAFASQTVQSTNKPVLNGSEGLGDVWTSEEYRTETGSLFAESLISKVLKSSSSDPKTQNLMLDSYCFGVGAYSLSTGRPTTHKALSLPAVSNGSPAVKTLWYQTSDNGQVGLNFAYNELAWGADWGDDSTIRIIDGQGTYVNLNGDTCLYGTNELAIPYGWTSNHARAGTQTEGVDL